VFDSRAYDEARPTPILGYDCDEWTSHSVSGDLKYSSATYPLEVGWCGWSPFDPNLFMVKVEQYVI